MSRGRLRKNEDELVGVMAFDESSGSILRRIEVQG